MHVCGEKFGFVGRRSSGILWKDSATGIASRSSIAAMQNGYGLVFSIPGIFEDMTVGQKAEIKELGTGVVDSLRNIYNRAGQRSF